MTGRESLRRDLQKRLVELDKLPSGAVITDVHGHVWQKGRDYWYRAFDSDRQTSEWELAQVAGSYQILQPAAIGTSGTER